MDRTAEKEKPEPQLRARHWGMGSPVLWVHPTQPPCATTHLCPFLMVHFSPLQVHFRLLFPNPFISASRSNFTKTETVWLLEVEQRCGCAAFFMGGMEGLEHLCLWVCCCETLCTLLQGVTLQHPRG